MMFEAPIPGRTPTGFEFAAITALKSDAKMTTVIITDANFAAEVLQSKDPVLVYFWANWGNPSKMQMPNVEQVCAGMASPVTFAKLNIDDSPITAQQYPIRFIPTLIVFKAGQEVGILSGGSTGVLGPRSQIAAWLHGLI